MYHDKMRYIDFHITNPRCIHCYINDRAYASIIMEVMTNGQNETGGVLLGYIFNRAWYIVESVDPGMDTVNQVAFFEWDDNYVNHQATRLSKIYQRPITILGFWHRHPGSMDYFSGQDEKTIRSNLLNLKQGLLSMLVNIDPKLRMTFYYCYENEIMPIRYDVGNAYFPAEFLQYADAKELFKRAYESGHPMEIHYEQVINLKQIAQRQQKKILSQPVVQNEEHPASKNNAMEMQMRELKDEISLLRTEIKELMNMTTQLMEKVIYLEADLGSQKEMQSVVENVKEILLENSEKKMISSEEGDDDGERNLGTDNG